MNPESDPEVFLPETWGPADAERGTAFSSIRAMESAWKPAETAVALGGVRWLPDLVAPDRRLLHLALSGEIPQAIMRRLQVSAEANWELTVALGSLEVECSTLLLLQELDSRIVFIRESEHGVEAEAFRSVADWVAKARISLTAEDLRTLAGARLRDALADSTTVKGRLYEEALCLVLSQVPWLTVDEHAYRNDSEEIDLVLGVHAVGHVAQLAKGAVAIATAKNERKATDSATVKYLKEQMANRKGRCNLGFLCSATTVSPAAKTEILRGSQASEFVLVVIDGSDLQQLIARADRLDDELQRLIRRAVSS